MKSLLRRSAIILSLLTLVVYLGFILHDLFQSHSVLQQSVSMRLLDDTDRLGSAIGYFFSERLNDLSDLKETPSLSAYYENLALGTPMEYRLAASLEEVNATFRKFSDKKALGGKSIYKRLVFLEADGRKLVDSNSEKANENKGEEKISREFLYPKDARHQFFVSGQEADTSIVISIPYLYRGKYKGSILTWLSLQEIFHFFLAGFSGKDTPIFFI
jgi:hypothetical protein